MDYECINFGHFNICIYSMSDGHKLINLTPHDLLIDGDLIPKPDDDVLDCLNGITGTYEVNTINTIPIYNTEYYLKQFEDFLNELFDDEYYYDFEYVIITGWMRDCILQFNDVESIETNKFLVTSGSVMRDSYHDDAFCVSGFHTIRDERVF